MNFNDLRHFLKLESIISLIFIFVATEESQSNESNHLTTLDPVKLESNTNANDNLQHQLDVKLDENAKLLLQLRQAQYDRLCQPSYKIHQIIPSSQQQKPSETLNESEIAEKLVSNLCEITNMSSHGPEQIISPETIRHNLGIVVQNGSTNLEEL